MHILIVDDNAPLAQNIAEILESEGHRVVTAESGEEALEVAKRSSFDGALLDVRMPGMDGIDLCIRLQELRPDAFYCLMTAYSVDERIKEALASGVKGVLSKPLALDALLACVAGVTPKVATTDNDPDGAEIATS